MKKRKNKKDGRKQNKKMEGVKKMKLLKEKEHQ